MKWIVILLSLPQLIVVASMSPSGGWHDAHTVLLAPHSSVSTWSAQFLGREAPAIGQRSERGIWSWFEFWSTTHSSSWTRCYWLPCCCSCPDIPALRAPTWSARCAKLSEQMTWCTHILNFFRSIWKWTSVKVSQRALNTTMLWRYHSYFECRGSYWLTKGLLKEHIE